MPTRRTLSIDYRCTTAEEMDARERFDIVLAMEVVEHVTDVGAFLPPLRCHAQARRHDGGLDAEPQLEELCARHRRRGICAALAAARHPSVGQVRHPDELAHHLANNKLAISEQAGVVYSPFADKWSLSSDMDVNYMVVAEGI